MGGLAAKLIAASPNLHNQIIEDYNGPDKDNAEEEKIVEDAEIEVLLEYAMIVASASPNSSAGIILTKEDIEKIINQLSKIKLNISFY